MKEFTLTELSAISQMIKNEKLCADKCSAYSKNCSDPDLKQKFQQFSAKHNNHCNLLLKLLEEK